MAVTIDATNLTLVDVADSTTGWTSSIGGLNTTSILTRQGGTSLQDQASQEQYNIYHTIASTSLTAHTVFGWTRSGGPATEADASGAGFALYAGDGTNNRAYDVGGSDNYAFFYSGWSSFRLNTAGLPTSFIQDGGGAPSFTGITRLGYGGYFPAKAAGNSDNIAIDVLRYVSNSSPALLIEGGTTGARGTWGEVTTEDENTTNAWGIIRRLVTGSKAFEVMFGLQVGSLDANSYFEDADFQLFINGQVTSGGTISANSLNFDFVGWASGTNVINFDNFFIQNIGTVSNWDASDTNIDELKWTNGQFVDMGTFIFQAQDAGNKFVTDCTFVNCGQVTPVGIDMDNVTFLGSTNANGALFWNGSTVEENQDNLTFVSDGTGHGIEISLNTASTTTFNISGYTESGYAATDGSTGNEFFYVDNALDGDVDINITGGSGNFSVRLAAGYTGTVTVTQDPAVSTVTVLDNTGAPYFGARVILRASDGTGPLPYQDSVTITRSGSTATVSHTSHGLTTGKKVEIKGADQIEYNGAKTITVTGTNSYTFTVSGTPTTPATGTITSTGLILEGTTDSAGQITDSRTLGTDQPVSGVVRKATTTPYFKPFPISGTVDTVTGLSINVRMILDQ